jgi:hypothetical protein
MEGIHDAPDGAEEAYEWGYGAGYCQPGHVSFEARHFFGAGNLHGALHCEAAALALVFRESVFENRY